MRTPVSADIDFNKQQAGRKFILMVNERCCWNVFRADLYLLERHFTIDSSWKCNAKSALRDRSWILSRAPYYYNRNYAIQELIAKIMEDEECALAIAEQMDGFRQYYLRRTREIRKNIPIETRIKLLRKYHKHHEVDAQFCQDMEEVKQEFFMMVKLVI